VSFPYKAGVTCAAAAAIGLLWFYGKKLRAGGASVAFTHARRKAVSFEWGTVFLLMGLFIVVGTLSAVGLIEAIAGAIRAITGGKLFLTFMAIVWISVLLSGFIDNIPYVTALVPVVLPLGKSMGSSPREVSLLLFGLLIGRDRRWEHHPHRGVGERRGRTDARDEGAPRWIRKVHEYRSAFHHARRDSRDPFPLGVLEDYTVIRYRASRDAKPVFRKFHVPVRRRRSSGLPLRVHA
jgi:hypothetical protein